MTISSIRHLAFILKCKATEPELIQLTKQLSDESFCFDDQFYREKKDVSKLPNGKLKTRILNPSLKRLKLIQARIKKKILDNIQFPSYIQGGLRGCSNITNASMHLGNKFKFTTDIKRFFPSITPALVYKAFFDLGFKPDVARILTILTTYKGRLPQGAPTSAHIANLVFLKTDERIHANCQKKQIIYTRYIDDITLSAREDFKNDLPEILDMINLLGFKISARKTQYRHIIDITGIKTANNGLKPNDKFYRKLDTEQNDSAKEARMSYLERVKATKKNGIEVAPALNASPQTSPKKQKSHES
jgi:RNA-directed DNA polymerase